MPHSLLTIDQYRRAVGLRDLTDPSDGPHAMQALCVAIVTALAARWRCRTIEHRANPVVPIEDNYDRLSYPPDGAARDARYTRYVSERLLLRTQTSAMIPPLLERLSDAPPDDVLLVCPGLVYRRDAIDRLHTGEPHQIDLWRVRRGAPLARRDLDDMIATVVEAALPGYSHRVVDADHPYTVGGLQIDVACADEWVEIGECGLAHPDVLGDAGLGAGYTGLAMGLGLDRILMLRKQIPDIRLLRAADPRVASQMLDLEPYRPVSDQPAVRRDLSIAVGADTCAEQLGDRVRCALGARVEAVEEISIVSETAYAALPPQAIARMGVARGQKNVLVRVVLRHPARTLTSAEANELRNAVYAAIHEGQRHEWSANPRR